MDEVARAPGPQFVVAGTAPVALSVVVAALRAGRSVVRLLDPSEGSADDDPPALTADVGALLATAATEGRFRTTPDPAACAGFAVALVTEPPDSDAALSPVEHYTAALAPQLRAGGLLAVSSATAEHAGVVAAATVELLTGLRAGPDYALAFLLPPSGRGRLIVSGVDDASATRAVESFGALGLLVMPVLPVAAAEVVASLLARAERPPDEPGVASG